MNIYLMGVGFSFAIVFTIMVIATWNKGVTVKDLSTVFLVTVLSWIGIVIVLVVFVIDVPTVKADTVLFRFGKEKKEEE